MKLRLFCMAVRYAGGSDPERAFEVRLRQVVEGIHGDELTRATLRVDQETADGYRPGQSFDMELVEVPR